MVRLGGARRRGDAGVRRPRRRRRPPSTACITQLGPFSEAGIPAFESLGEAAKVGTPAMIAARPIVARPARASPSRSRPVGGPPRRCSSSLQETGGFERVLDYVFYQVAAINGFDSFGHYLRAGLIVNQCSTYAIDADAGLLGELRRAANARPPRRVRPDGPRDPVLAATAAAIRARDGRRDPSRRRRCSRRRRPQRDGPAQARRPSRRRPRRPRRAATAAPRPPRAPTPSRPDRPAATSRCSTTCSGRTRG